MIEIHSNLKDALKDLKARCNNPTQIVFDIDGTLLVGKNPVHLLCMYYRNICARSNCEVKLLTARPCNMYENTTKQLKKNGLDIFDELIMKNVNISETEAIFKRRLIKELNPQISIGNRWHDLNVQDDVEIDHLPDDQYVVGEGWLKMPTT